MRRAAAVLAVALAVGLGACGERDQSTANAKRNADKPAWDSANARYVVPGYAPGNQGAWESQLRERAQAQNDYAPRK